MKWEKLVAIMASIPMLTAVAPAASAAEQTSASDDAASRTIQTATQSANIQTDSDDLLASLNFNDMQAGATGILTDATSGTSATIRGTAATGIGKDGSTAAQLGQGFWLSLAKADGSAVLKDRNAITISYDSKSSSTNQGWSFFAAPDTNAQIYTKEHYIGVMDTTTSLKAERYNNSGDRVSIANVSKDSLKNSWRHVDLVLEPAASTLYIDGDQVAQSTPSDGAQFAQLSDILGADGGILQIGKANWVNGEYYAGMLDNLNIYGSAHSADQIKSEYDAAQTKLAEADTNALTIPDADDVRSDISLPSTGSINKSTITWQSSNPDIVSDTADGDIAAGVVNRQNADATVTLTAQINATDGSSATKKFDVKVKAAVEQPKTTDYLFAHFTGTEGSASDEQMYFATSEDGLSWHDTRESGDPILTSNLGEQGVRDPYLVRSPQGDTFYLIATDLSIYHRGGWGNNPASQYNGSKDLIVWKSHDLVHWDAPYAADVASRIPHAAMAWAPEAYWIPELGEYMVYWATTSDQDDKGNATDPTNMYYSLTRDFVTFSNPVKWIDRDQSVIDTTMIKAEDGYYYRVSGDTYLGVERSKNPLAITQTTGAPGYNTNNDPNQWNFVGLFKDLVGNSKWTGAKLEGPELFRYNDDDVQTTAAGKKMLYGLMWDQYAEGKGYLPFYSADLGSTDTADWAAASAVNFGSLKKRHGTILPITATEYDAIMSAFDKNKPLAPVDPDEDGSAPIAQYTFEDGKGTDSAGSNDLSFAGNAKVVDDADKGKVLSLDGANGSYAAFPQGMFDRRNKMTVSMDVISEINANQFTFTFGKDTNKYYFMKYNTSGELASRITTGSYGSESAANATLRGNGAWHRATVTLDDNVMTVYSDGVQVAQNTATGTTVSDLGTNLLAYLGKSFYNDAYFKGSFDNICVWNRALSAAEIAQASDAPAFGSLVVGTAPSSKEADTLRGTDDYSAVRSDIDREAKTISPVVNRRAEVSKLPVTFSLTYPNSELSVDGQHFSNGDMLDLSQDHKLVVEYGKDKSETWTLKKATVSNNPVLPGQYADPDIDYFDGKFWIYPTTDGFSGWSGNYFHAFSSTDLVDWTDEGVILDVNKDHEPTTDGDKSTAISPWSVGSAWAPTIEKKNGKYYFYYCAKLPNGTSAIGVAVADSPAGPFTAAAEPIVTNSMEGISVGQAIDPSIFTDPNTGISYILYGNGSAAIAELNDDMVSIKPGTVRRLNGLNDFRESVIVAYRDGVYHWTWSCDDAGSPNYHVNYGTSNSLDGMITYHGTILQKDSSKQLQGTAHQSDVHVTDADGNERWFMAYHRHYTPLGIFSSGLGYHRETAIDEIHFDADGLMQTINPSDEGVSITMANATALNGAIQAASNIANDGYTDDSWNAFDASLKAAQEAYQRYLDEGLSQADVDTAAVNLAAAQKSLTKQESPTKDVIQSIAVTKKPDKSDYAVGETLDPTGLEVTATIVSVAQGKGIGARALAGATTRVLKSNEYDLLGFDSARASDKVTVTVQLKEDPSKTATFTVTVKAASDSGEGQVPSTKPDETKPGAGHETKAPHGVLSSTGSAVIGVVVLVTVCALAGIGITLWRKRFA